MNSKTAGDRLLFLAIAVGAAILFAAGLHFLLPSLASPRMVNLVLGVEAGSYPLSIQNLMYLCFFIGLGELGWRLRTCLAEETLRRVKLLPEADDVVLNVADAVELRRRIVDHYGPAPGGMLLELVNRCILQFQTTRAVAETHELLNSMLELHSHRIDLDYTMARYLAWLIPTLGFIGTIMGIAGSLEGFGVGGAEPDFDAIKNALYTAFDTTLIALVLSAVLVFGVHLVSSREERGLNRSAEYCLINLINRLLA